MTDPMDAWIRQVLGNTGQVSYEDAMRGLAQIKKNVGAGLFATTGGAVSLMARNDVATLHRANSGLFAKFRPRVPDRDNRPAKSLEDWYVAAIEQALFVGSRPFDLRLVDAMDGFLHTYQGANVDWKRVHSFAATVETLVPEIGKQPLWQERGPEPSSVLAFCGWSKRSTSTTSIWRIHGLSGAV